MMEFVRNAAEIATGIVASATVLAFLWTIYRKTIGRRRDLQRRISRLGTNAQLSFFSSIIDAPPAIRRRVEWADRRPAASRRRPPRRGGYENIYVDPLFFVQALTGEDGTVLAYSVTARHRRFHPRLRSSGAIHEGERAGLSRLLRGRERLRPVFDVTLGKTRFVSLGAPQHAEAHLGARRFFFHESHWLGNPGNYQWYVFAVNDAGTSALDVAPQVLLGPTYEARWNFEAGDEDALDEARALKEYRNQALINTYTVIGPGLSPEEYPLTYGADGDHVRTLLAERGLVRPRTKSLRLAHKVFHRWRERIQPFLGAN